MALTAPQIDLLPDPPLPTDAEATFDAKAGASLAAQQVMVPQINASLTWIGQQVSAAEGYARQAAETVEGAQNAADLAAQSADAAQAAAAAAALSAGLPSLAGNARRPMAVLPNEQGASWQTQIKALYIEPMLKANTNGAVVIDVGASGVFDFTLTANTSFTFANLPQLSATETIIVLVRLTNGATAYSANFPASIVWLTGGQVVPAAPNAGKTSEYILSFEGARVVGRKGSGT